MPWNPHALLRSPSYLQLLVIAAVLGVPVSAAACGFLALVNYLQQEVFRRPGHPDLRRRAWAAGTFINPA